MRSRTTSGLSGANIGSEYTDEEREFLAAISDFKRRTGCVCPTWPQILAIARSLGWRKAAPSMPLPTYPLRRRPS